MDSIPKTVLTSRIVGDVAVFDVEGELSITRCPVPTLQDLAKDQLDRGMRKILFNFEKTVFVDSCGVGQLIATFTSAQNVGGSLKLAAVPQRLYLVLKITKIIDIVRVYPDETTALESFAKPPEPGPET